MRGSVLMQATLMRSFLFIVLAGYIHLSHAEPLNLASLKQTLKHYHDSGLYEQEVASVAAQASDYIKKRVQANENTPNPQKLAIVLDVDETSLSTYQQILQDDFAHNIAHTRQHLLAAVDPAMHPILRLYHTALKQGIKFFFVTGRPHALCPATKKNLRLAGYTHWTALYCRPNTYHATSIVPFKIAARKAISEKGYLIIASIGDQHSDVSGLYTGRGFKLPNPFYLII